MVVRLSLRSRACPQYKVGRWRHSARLRVDVESAVAHDRIAAQFGAQLPPGPLRRPAELDRGRNTKKENEKLH